MPFLRFRWVGSCSAREKCLQLIRIQLRRILKVSGVSRLKAFSAQKKTMSSPPSFLPKTNGEQTIIH